MKPLHLFITAALTFAIILPAHADPQTLVVYSGRSKSLVEPLIRQFREQTGITVEERYGETAQLAAALREEGARSPADVFWAQDAGALGAVVKAGLLAELPEDVLNKVETGYRGADGRWVATSGRARVLAYSPQRVQRDALPKHIADLTDARWRGKVGWAPTNASFQAFVTALRKAEGDDAARAWLQAMKDNGTKTYPKNTGIIEAIAAGEIDLGLPNHYYLLQAKANDANFPVEQTAFADGDIGNLVNVAGVGVLGTSDSKEAAQRFVEFLLSPEAQRYFVQQTHEYPVVEGVPADVGLATPEQLRERAPKVELESLEDLEGTLEMLRSVGLI